MQVFQGGDLRTSYNPPCQGSQRADRLCHLSSFAAKEACADPGGSRSQVKSNLDIDQHRHSVPGRWQETQLVSAVQVCSNMATERSPLFSEQPVPYSLSSHITNPRSLEAAVEAAADFLNKVPPFPLCPCASALALRLVEHL